MLTALRKEMLKPQNLTKLPDIIEALSQVITTDFPPDKIDQLLALSDIVEEEPSRSWIFKTPQWATHLPWHKAGGRPVTFPRMDKIAELSIGKSSATRAYGMAGRSRIAAGIRRTPVEPLVLGSSGFSPEGRLPVRSAPIRNDAGRHRRAR